MNIKKSIFPILVLISLNMVLLSCKGKDDEPDLRYEYLQANAQGVVVDYWDDRVDYTYIYLWINSNIIKKIGTSSEEYRYIIESNDQNRVYYPMDMDIVEELIMDHSGWPSGDINDHPDTKAIYEYVQKHKSQYQYVSYTTAGLTMFNRSSEVNY